MNQKILKSPAIVSGSGLKQTHEDAFYHEFLDGEADVPEPSKNIDYMTMTMENIKAQPIKSLNLKAIKSHEVHKDDDSDSDFLNEFDEKLDQNSFLGLKSKQQSEKIQAAVIAQANDSDFDDDGFISDEVDENRSILQTDSQRL